MYITGTMDEPMLLILLFVVNWRQRYRFRNSLERA